MGSDSLKKLLSSGAVWQAHASSPEDRRVTRLSPEAECQAECNKLLNKETLNFNNLSNTKKLITPFAIPEVDKALPEGGLQLGGIHEWFLPDALIDPFPFYAPTTLLVFLIKSCINTLINKAGCEYKDFKKLIVWIGRNSWPTPLLLQQTITPALLPNCIFVDPPDYKKLLWTIDTTLSSSAVAATVIQLETLSLAKSKRFALKSRENQIFTLLVKAPKSLSTPGAALSSWSVKAHPALPFNHPEAEKKTYTNQIFSPTWELKLLRKKGPQTEQNRWLISLNEAKFCLETPKLNLKDSEKSDYILKAS